MATDAPRILAFDTSSQVTALAVCAGSTVLVEQHLQTENRHAESLLPSLQQALREAQLALSDIDCIAVGVGPGSFTGVRVGVATAKGLGLSLAKPVFAIVSLDALALEAVGKNAESRVAVCMDAYKGELFAAVYARQGQSVAPLRAPFHAAPARVRQELAAVSGDEPLLLVGAGVARYPDLLTDPPSSWRVDSAIAAPRASAVAQLALPRFVAGELPALQQVAPLYLRGSDAQLPKVPLRV